MNLQGTYRSPSEEELQRFPALLALEQLDDHFMADDQWHRLHRCMLRVCRSKVVVWGPQEGNAASGQSRCGHDASSGEIVAVEGGFGVDLAPDGRQGNWRCMETAPGHYASKQAASRSGAVRCTETRDRELCVLAEKRAPVEE